LNQDFGERQMFDATCSKCGNATQVPFQPSGDRPVYCRDCFQQMRGEKRGGGGFGGGAGGDRQMYDAVCATCGAATQVPFKPSGERPVYCREHYKRDRN
jgi:CxxC-x17-CxxC domain-containing protein